MNVDLPNPHSFFAYPNPFSTNPNLILAKMNSFLANPNSFFAYPNTFLTKMNSFQAEYIGYPPKTLYSGSFQTNSE